MLVRALAPARAVSAAALLAALAALAACAGGAAGPTAPSKQGAPAGKAATGAAGPTAGKPGADTRSAAGPIATPVGMDTLPPRAQRLFAEAVQADAEQRKASDLDWALLERRWRAVLEAADVPEAHYNLAVTLDARGRLDEARAEYERARAGKPSLRQAAVNLGVLQEKGGDLRGAQATYAAVIRDFPEDARARERLAALYLGAGQLDEAWRLAREALLRDPRSVAANKVMVKVALQRNDLDLAKLVADRTTRLDGADPELPYLAGQILSRQGEEAKAEAQYRKALSLDPHLLAARGALLGAAVKAKRWPAVAEHAEAWLKEEPGNAQVWLALGIARRHQDRPDDALAAYAKAEELSGGKLPEVNLARGVLLMRVKNECEPALEEFRKYTQGAGPVATTESSVPKLQRECEAIVDENRKAAEAAAEMQRAAEKKKVQAQEKGDGKATPDGKAAEGGAAPTPPPIEAP
jgi:Flp pilus assembly protein TadD